MNYTLKLFIVLCLGTQLSMALFTIPTERPAGRPSNLSSVVGTTKGEFSVNQGTANYNLKIDVPPGVAGMEPKLSLNYSSGGGNGYMGIGWSIGGVSSITRCSQTKAVDGTNHKFGVKYNSDDRFCLDGQRLINVSGVYGADGTEYRTEIDTYAKVVSRGSYGGGPRYFDVYTKSGLRYIYGAAETTYQFNKPGLTMKLWKVDRIIDTYNNQIAFNYTVDYVKGIHRLNKVTYADNTVQYNYERRRDTRQGYHGGYPFLVDKRLKEVIVKTGSTEVRRYKIAYTSDTPRSVSKLTSITEHVVEGDLKKLSMTYQNSTGKLKISTRTPATKTKDAHYIDINGDGCVDVYSNNNWIAGDCKGGWTGGWKSTGTSAKNDEIKFADFDGDGDVDFIVKSTSTDMKRTLEGLAGKKINAFHFLPAGVISNYPAGFSVNFKDGTQGFVPITTQYTVYTNDGNGIFHKTLWSTMGAWKIDEIKLSDFNHDGKMDILMQDVIYLQTDNYFWKSKKMAFSTDKHEEIKLLDINADGLVDIYEVDEGNDIVHFNNGNMTFTKRDYVPIYAEHYDIKFSDLNGDGAVDIYQVTSGADKIWINDGKGNFMHKYSPNISASTNEIRLVDVNGDGYPDIYDIDDGNDNIWLNDGKGDFSGRSYELSVQSIPEKLRFVDINGDGLVDMINTDTTNKIFFNQAKEPLLIRITNKTDQDIKVTYKPMTDQAIYHNYSVNGQRNTHPFNKIANDNIELTTSLSLVYTVNTANGTNLKSGTSPFVGYNQVRYRYYGYVLNKLRGFQGFHAIDTYDDTSRMKSVDFYAQIGSPNGVGFQYTGMPVVSYSGLEYGTAWDYWLNKTVIQYRDASKRSKIYEPYAYATVQTIHEPGTTTAIKSIYHNNYLSTDGLGNINKIIDKIEDYVNHKNFNKITINEYTEENKPAWHIGRLTKASVVHTQTDGGTVTRSSTFKYDKTTGVLIEEVANAGTTLALKKAYTYDAKGNKKSETISGKGLITAQTRYDYGTQYGGKFLTHIDYPDGTYQMIPTYDERFGTATSIIDTNNLKTTWNYDSMGRKTLETRADGTWNKWEHAWYSNTANINSIYLYAVKETQSGTTHHTTTFYDGLGRETAKDTSTLGDKVISRYKYYNDKGELYKETLPYIPKEESPKYINTIYDKYGRTTKVTKPGPNGTTQTYTMSQNNFTRITTNPKGQKKKTVQNAIGQTISITDAYGSTIASSINYKFDAVGNLKESRDSAGHKILMTYDEVGNKIYMSDPDLGTWYYQYNAVGKLTKQWSGTKGYYGSKQATYNVYDVLGRLIRTNTRDLDRSNVTRKTSYNYTKFTYGDASATIGSKGKLLKVYASSKMKGKDWHAETKTTSYDSLGRPISHNTYINYRGDYHTSITYDAYSRPSITTYPNGYKITNHYNNGILDYVKGSDGKIHYKINKLTPFGEIADASFGNSVRVVVGHDNAGFVESIRSGQNGSYYTGNVQQVHYTYDGLGNVVTRNDYSIDNKNLSETFTYDDMNRLTGFEVNTDITIEAFRNARTYTYDKLGNMTSKTGYGKYTYSSNKPHAVTKVGRRTYAYDNVGNMTNRNGDIITYNPLSKPAILKNKNGKEVRFYYGVGGQRFMKITDKKQTFYIGKGYEEEQQVGSNEVKSTIYINIGGKTIGTHVEVLDKTYDINPDNPKYKKTYNRYFHTDVLGSITAITNDAGEVVERRSYEPFGKIRAMDYGLAENNAIIPAYTVSQTLRAFTGHEQIAELSGLIHMNARVYDSAIGRFLSADTIIQDPHDSQSYNRYSYVRNNPLKYTDPTGNSWWTKFRDKWVKPIAAIVVGAILVTLTGGAFAGALGAFWGSVATGALAGAAGGAIMTGTLKGTLKGAAFGALSAGMAYGIGESFGHAGGLFGKGVSTARAVGKSLAHALSRGAISHWQGGTFRSGFASGFASSFFNPGTQLGGEGAGGFTLRTTIAGVVGGTASEIGGGKFSNGAISGAFVHMFNAENLVKDWLTGSGSRMRVYGPKNRMTKDLSTDPAIKYFKNQFLSNYGSVGDAKYYPVKFGITDFFFANSNTLANIGSYGLSIYQTGSDELTYVISNDMGFNSLTAGVFPNIDSGSMSTIETWFWWKEPIR